MGALTANYDRPHMVHHQKTIFSPANAGEKFFTGGYVLREAATGVVTKVVAAGNIPLGVIPHAPLSSDDPLRDVDAHLDNTNGADGAIDGNGSYVRCVLYDTVDNWGFALAAGSATPKVGETAYLVNDNEVSTVDPGAGVAAGTFSRPCEQISGGWFVNITHAALLTRLLALEAAT
jgi:hypothetical protein